VNYAQSGWVNPHIQLGGANGISLDRAGNRYIADIDNYKVRKYSPSGQPLMSFGASDWQSTTDGFGTITDTAVDSRGIIYVADGDNYRVQVYDQNGNFLRTIGGVSGTGDGELNYAYQMVVDSQDNLYVIDDKRVQEFDKDGNFLQVIATPDMIHDYGNGYTGSTLQSIAIDTNDAIYVTEASYLTLSQVQKFSSNGTLLASFGTYDSSPSNPTPGAMNYPGAIAVDSLGNVFVSDYNYINVFNSAGVAQSKTYIGDVGTEQVAAVGDMVFDSSDNLQIANIRPNRILTLNHSLQFVSEFGQSGTQNGHFYGMLGVYRDEAAGKMYVSDALNGRIQVLDLNGNYLSKFGSYGNDPGQLDRPGHIVKNPITGNLYINDFNGLEIFTPSGTYVNRLTGFGTAGIAFDASGKMYTATSEYSTPSGGAIRDNDGNVLSTFGATGTPATGKISYPSKVTLDASGNIYVADLWSSYIQIYAPDGTFLRNIGGVSGSGDGQFSQPNDVQVASDGTVYVADTGNGRFQIFDNNGTYLSQFGSQGFGPGKFQYPQAFSIASNGTFYVADDVNDFLAVYSPTGNTTPSVPMNFSVSSDSAASWSTPSSTGGSPVASYTLRHKSTSATNWAEVTLPAGTTSYSFGSQPADTYQYELTASNSAGESVAAAPGSAATTATAPQSVSLTSGAANTLTATWQAPVNDGGSPITGYLFEYKPAASSSWTQLSLPDNPTSHTLSNVPAGNYDVRVSAINSAGTSAPSVVATVAITDAPAPSSDPTPSPAPTTPYVAPPAVHTKVGDVTTTEPSSLITSDSTESPASTLRATTNPSTPGSVTVTWQAPTGQPPTGYVIEYRDASIPARDTTTPWHYSTTADAYAHNTVITLPAGEYMIRVAALFPGEQARIILGVAHISVATYNAAMGSANHSTTPAATTKAKSVPLWIVACVCGLMTAFLFIIFVAWKRRRKKQQELSTNTYRQRL